MEITTLVKHSADFVEEMIKTAMREQWVDAAWLYLLSWLDIVSPRQAKIYRMADSEQRNIILNDGLTVVEDIEAMAADGVRDQLMTYYMEDGTVPTIEHVKPSFDIQIKTLSYDLTKYRSGSKTIAVDWDTTLDTMVCLLCDILSVINYAKVKPHWCTTLELEVIPKYLKLASQYGAVLPSTTVVKMQRVQSLINDFHDVLPTLQIGVTEMTLPINSDTQRLADYLQRVNNAADLNDGKLLAEFERIKTFVRVVESRGHVPAEFATLWVSILTALHQPIPHRYKSIAVENTQFNKPIPEGFADMSEILNDPDVIMGSKISSDYGDRGVIVDTSTRVVPPANLRKDPAYQLNINGCGRVAFRCKGSRLGWLNQISAHIDIAADGVSLKDDVLDVLSTIEFMPFENHSAYELDAVAADMQLEHFMEEIRATDVVERPMFSSDACFISIVPTVRQSWATDGHGNPV